MLMLISISGALAQWIESQTSNLSVGGSSPSCLATKQQIRNSHADDENSGFLIIMLFSVILSEAEWVKHY